MKRISFITLVVSVSSIVPTVQATDYTCPRSGWDHRCLTLTNQRGSVVITNTSASEVEFAFHEWISNCGWPGVRVTEETHTVGPGNTVVVTMKSDADPYKCREDFVFDCYTPFGGEKDCGSLLRVVVRVP